MICTNHLKKKNMLYYQIQNYEEFKRIFGTVKQGDGTSGRKNKVLLAYLKDKRLLHEAVTSNRYGLLHITDMAGLEAAMEREILKSGDESPGLPYRLVLMGKTYRSAVYETDSNEGICEDGDTKAVRYVNRKTGKTFKMKAGKLYRSLLLETEFGKRLPQKVVTYLSEKFAADWQVYATGKSPKSRLHVNLDFRRIYSSECCEGDFSSCMTDKGFHPFYKDAVDASAAYIENEDGKVIARCIIFNEVKDEDGEIWRLAERQYASDNNDILKQTLVEALIDGGHIDGYKKVGAGCGDARAFVDIHGNSLAHKKFRISCDLDWGDTLSYQDSFKYYDECKRIADNYDHGTLSLEETGGSLDGDDEREYDDYHDYECDEVQQVYVHGEACQCDINNLGDFVLVESLDEYHHRDDVRYCPQCGAAFLEKDRFYSDITQEGYCSEECWEDAEDAYREKYWHYSDYDGKYFEEEEDIAYYRRWNREQEEYEEKTISVTSLNRLLCGDEFFQFGDLYFNEVDPATNLPYGYKLVKMEE